MQQNARLVIRSVDGSSAAHFDAFGGCVCVDDRGLCLVFRCLAIDFFHFSIHIFVSVFSLALISNFKMILHDLA